MFRYFCWANWKKIAWACVKLDNYSILTLSVPPSFSILPEQVVSDLSTNQVYAYSICLALIYGKVDDDLAYVEVGHIVHSRWLTLGCRILR